jgi:hypothetical protein
MNFILGLVWLAGAVGLILYEQFTGKPVLRMRGTGLSLSWLLLGLALYNFVRWYSARAFRASQRDMYYEREARLRHIRSHDRPEPDPTFDFSDQPPEPAAPPPAPPNQHPPSNN